MTKAAILAIDQGTTSSRAIVFAPDLSIKGLAQQEYPQHFPASGHVEHDAEDIWITTLKTARDALQKAKLNASEIAALGITNQRETCVIWDRKTGKSIHRALVWQDRRTVETCAQLRADGLEPEITQKTGLLLDPYFSATKITWLLDQVPGARARAENGELAVGTIDTFLLWRLTGGRSHATDATNASRTMLYNITTGAWDDELLRIFKVPRALLPTVRDSNAHFGDTDAALLGSSIAIRGIAGDQQAALMGQACFKPGMVKSTYGTGCFALINIGATPALSKNKLLTTVAYQIDGKRTYALEGSIFIAGAAVQWLRDGPKIIKSATESGTLAAQSDPTQDVILVPAFVGLGAPHWQPDARGAIFGLTRNSGPAEFARAALESVAYQTHDLIAGMRADWPNAPDQAETVLRVDGGMVASDVTMQILADIIDAPVDRPMVLETTALGAAWLAGSSAGVWPDQSEFAKLWHLDRRFSPSIPQMTRTKKLDHWHRAVKATIAYSSRDPS